MNIQEQIEQWKKDPEFVRNVGMILCHNGIVRGTSRQGGEVVAVKVRPDRDRIEALRREFEHAPGIFKIAVDAREGELWPGDDLLFILVAGDIREHVKATLAELLDRIKAEAVTKEEILVTS